MLVTKKEMAEIQRRTRMRNLGPELAAALRKVTAELRNCCQKVYPNEPLILLAAGVLEAEALLRRIDEGGG